MKKMGTGLLVFFAFILGCAVSAVTPVILRPAIAQPQTQTVEVSERRFELSSTDNRISVIDTYTGVVKSYIQHLGIGTDNDIVVFDFNTEAVTRK